jgi:hypothetical protein
MVFQADTVHDAMEGIKILENKLIHNSETQTDLSASFVRDVRQSERSFTVGTQTLESADTNITRYCMLFF